MADTDRPTHIDILITCGSDDEAHTIAAAQVERRVAACVKAMPIRSVYRWDGAVQDEAEAPRAPKKKRVRKQVFSAIMHFFYAPHAAPHARGPRDHSARALLHARRRPALLVGRRLQPLGVACPRRRGLRGR